MKKILTATLSLVMLFSVSVMPLKTVNAAHVHNDNHVHETTIDSIITPFAQVCGNCDRGVLIQSKSFGSWYRARETRCSHGFGYGTDIEERRSVTITLKCNTCSAGTSYAGTPESRTSCHGFNR
ncbi:hypothetical protein acsn021_13080 [Anaerocolumna cellulosilytica]|uniref:Uncharacterized protein n=1 Tax=Anaerocolumna cellulosilytica TaxID=433286 RepID=A0A6S6QXG1_9FIRM|nr:hypothetical protein [Anaerocolumna cellulosilytica]MBB5195963.1 hypothetical protein [Anaerocolumna cellulosilytica]BCJ93739.1 hypothetical protein acsn021_13080 [Anaerocolumna cellulosilytica]